MLQFVSKTSTLPVTLANLKEHLRITSSVTSEDTRVTALAWAAIDAIEVERGISLVQQTWDMVLPCFPRHKTPIRFPLPPLQSVTSVSYYDSDNTSQTWDSDEYYVVVNHRYPSELSPVTSYPTTYTRPDSITIRFVAGYTTLPPVAGHAIKLLVGAWDQLPAGEVGGTITSELKIGLDRLLSSLEAATC